MLHVPTNDVMEHFLVIKVIGSKVYVAWKQKMLHDVIGGHQAYIHEKIDLRRIEFCSG